MARFTSALQAAWLRTGRPSVARQPSGLDHLNKGQPTLPVKVECRLRVFRISNQYASITKVGNLDAVSLNAVGTLTPKGLRSPRHLQRPSYRATRPAQPRGVSQCSYHALFQPTPDQGAGSTNIRQQLNRKTSKNTRRKSGSRQIRLVRPVWWIPQGNHPSPPHGRGQRP